jgi:hypothetical protein
VDDPHELPPRARLRQARQLGATLWDALETPAPSRHPTCPRCRGRMHLAATQAYMRCAACRYQLAPLTPEQIAVIQAALADRPIPVSLPAYLAELALLQQGVTPVGYPRE